MVVSRGISLTLHSPESGNSLVPNALEEFLLPESKSHKRQSSRSTATRYVPVLPGSSFWLSYRVLVPPPPGLETKLFVFKLFIGGTHFSTWSVDGESDNPSRRWRGSCMFGMFEDPTVVDHTNGGKKVFQRRGFGFAPPPNANVRGKASKGHTRQESKDSDMTGSERRKLRKKRWSEEPAHPFTPPQSWAKTTATEANDERYIEIRVFRARGKRRIPRGAPPFDFKTFEASRKGGLDLKLAGYSIKGDPTRYYEFDLVDPRDEPYATFRFCYRTMAELKALGIALGEEDTPSPKGKEHPSKMMPPADSARQHSTLAKDSKTSLRQKFEMANTLQNSRDSSKARHDDVLNSNKTGNSDEDHPTGPAADQRRLSIPPSIKLLPSLGSWRWSSLYGESSTASAAAKEGEGPSLQSKSSVESLRRRRGQGLWRAFHEEREADHGAY